MKYSSKPFPWKHYILEDFFEQDDKAPLKRNILASNSNIHNEFRELIIKKNIE